MARSSPRTARASTRSAWATSAVVRVAVDGRPAPKGSRVYGRTKTGNTFTRPASKYELPWVETVAKTTQVAMCHHAQPEPPYAVELVFRLQAPKKNRREMP